ncbi:MAG: metal-dependent transcriptional regulator [Aquaticitalea sp.]
MVTQSEENYLKVIYRLGKQGIEAVSTNAIAEQMETRASSVTDMVKKLAEKDLANYVKYQGVSLTKVGRLTAASVIRKHRLWEYFLVNKLNFSWDEVHEVAEQLEHIKSEKLTNKLDEFLEFPKVDPHGDPIPDKQGNFVKISKMLLSECKVGAIGVFVGVKDSSALFLQYLDKQNISLGNKIKILQREDYDQSLEISINASVINISHQTANNLYIQTN